MNPLKKQWKSFSKAIFSLLLQQDCLSDRLREATHDDGSGARKNALQEQLPLCPGRACDRRIQRFLQGLVSESHPRDRDINAARNV